MHNLIKICHTGRTTAVMMPLHAWPFYTVFFVCSWCLLIRWHWPISTFHLSLIVEPVTLIHIDLSFVFHCGANDVDPSWLHSSLSQWCWFTLTSLFEPMTLSHFNLLSNWSLIHLEPFSFICSCPLPHLHLYIWSSTVSSLGGLLL